MTKAQSDLYSHHVFIFPFKWLSKKERGLLAEQTDLKNIDEFFSDNTSWLREAYRINNPAHYNEYNYFYDYVREALYDTYDGKVASPLHDPESGANHLLRHYRYNLNSGEGHYHIAIAQKDKDGQPGEDLNYSLEVDSILLQFYDTGVGILSFHLLNRDPEKHEPEDILRINQFGRRIYPPFFQLPDVQVGTQELFRYAGWDLPTGSELAKSISLQIRDQEVYLENWQAYSSPERFEGNPFLLPAFIGSLLPTKFLDAYQLTPVLDDRMFVVCWYGNDELAKAYKERRVEEDKNGNETVIPPQLQYLQDSWWYRFVFVDANFPTCQHEDMHIRLVQEATYPRWVNYGTFYGVTDYSFVLLTGTLTNLKDHKAAFLITHLQTIYYKLSELVLLQRASVQRFSDEITHISRLEKTNDHSPISERVGSLYRQYIRFINKVYFREATAQVQGVELYKLMQQQCRIEKLVTDLDGEIHELHNYSLQLLEKERNGRLEQLALLGTILLPPSLILAIFGVSILGQISKSCELAVMCWLAILISLSGLYSWLSYKEDRLWLVLLSVTMLLGISSPAYIVQCDSCRPEAAQEATALPQIREQLQSIQESIQQLPLPLPVVVDTTKTIEHD